MADSVYTSGKLFAYYFLLKRLFYAHFGTITLWTLTCPTLPGYKSHLLELFFISVTGIFLIFVFLYWAFYNLRQQIENHDAVISWKYHEEWLYLEKKMLFLCLYQ